MLKKDVFFIKELDCQDEIALIKSVLEKKTGILNLSFDILTSKMIVEYERQVISRSQIIKTVKKVGLQASIWDKSQTSGNRGSFWERQGKLFMVILCGIFLVLGFLSNLYFTKEAIKEFLHNKLEGYTPFISFGFYGLSILAGLWFVVPKAFYSVKRVRGDMNLLMFIAVIGAILIGQWFEGASVAFLFSLALVLEHGSIQRARRAISKLMNLSAKEATLIRGDKQEVVPVETLMIKNKILVKPGEKIPADAKIIEGFSSINQSPITGESMPIQKGVGDEIFAGTINIEAALVCEVTKLHKDTILAKMIHLVEEAHAKKAKTEKWIERFATIYTPVMILIAMAVVFVPPLVYDLSWLDWIYRGLVILVIACPCALVISTPVTIVSALTTSARRGVLIKGGIYLEIPTKLKAVAFDKTGTLTKGKPVVQKTVCLAQLEEEQLIKIAAALEISSHHPLAKAVVDYAKEKNIAFQRAENVVEYRGKGTEGLIDNVTYFIGSYKFLKEKQLESKAFHKEALIFEEQGQTVVVIGDETRILGLIAFSDSPREEMKNILNEFRKVGIERLIMLTGDNAKSAERIAKIVGIDEFYAELLPEDKMDAIESLKEKYDFVAMIGDGVNDAPAMASSSLGIAMGAIGSDVAIESSDVALMADDIGKVPWLIDHSKRTLKVIKQNVVFSLIIKMLFLGLAFFGLASLWMAIAADTGASLVVIFNGLRLLSRKDRN